MRAVAVLIALTLAACSGDKKSKPEPEATPAADDGRTYTCEEVGAHVAAITMAEPQDTPVGGNRMRPPDQDIARANAKARCERAQFTQAHMRCVMAGASRDDFLACNLPK